jgi:hypothetical protein
VKNLPANEKYTLGITTEFDPIWNQFKESIDDRDKADFIRKLIFQYLHVGRSSRNTINERTWDRVKIALKTYKKYNEGTLKLNEDYRDFYVVSCDEFNSPVYTLEEIKKICKDKGYSLNLDDNFSFPRGEYYDVRENQPKKAGKPFKYGRRPVRQHYGIPAPNIYLVIERRKNDSFDILEGQYIGLKKRKEKTISNLIYANQSIVSFFDEIGLFDWSPLMDVKLSENGKYGLDWNKNEISTEYGIPLDAHWEKTPPEIEKYLILKPWHLKNKKNFGKLKQDKRIKYTHSKAIKFDASKNNKILEIASMHTYSKIEDGSETPNQIIEVED